MRHMTFKLLHICTLFNLNKKYFFSWHNASHNFQTPPHMYFFNFHQKLYQTLKKCKLLSEEIRNSTEYTFIFETILLFISFNKNLHMDYRFHCSILNCLAEVGWKVDILNLFGRNYSSPSSELVLAGEGDPWAGCAVPGLPGGPGEDPGHQQELPPGALARTVHQL